MANHNPFVYKMPSSSGVHFLGYNVLVLFIGSKIHNLIGNYLFFVIHLPVGASIKPYSLILA